VSAVKHSSLFSILVDRRDRNPHDYLMKRTIITFPLRAVAAAALSVVLGAAGQASLLAPLPDVGPLAQPAPAPAKPLSFQNTIYQAAPVPNPDVDAPPNTAQPETRIGPRLISPKNLFQGDGYSYASAEQTDVHKTPAAGLGVTVPVN
jgi:hypothetical protein